MLNREQLTQAQESDFGNAPVAQVRHIPAGTCHVERSPTYSNTIRFIAECCRNLPTGLIRRKRAGLCAGRYRGACHLVSAELKRQTLQTMMLLRQCS